MSFRCRGAVIDQAPLAPAADVAPADRWKGLPSRARRSAQVSMPLSPRTPRSIPGISISGARSAYEMIVLAFANGDRRALKDLLSSEVYEASRP